MTRRSMFRYLGMAAGSLLVPQLPFIELPEPAATAPQYFPENFHLCAIRLWPLPEMPYTRLTDLLKEQLIINMGDQPLLQIPLDFIPLGTTRRKAHLLGTSLMLDGPLTAQLGDGPNPVQTAPTGLMLIFDGFALTNGAPPSRYVSLAHSL